MFRFNLKMDFVILGLLSCFTGCVSIFYYPDDFQYVNISSLSPKSSEFFLNVQTKIEYSSLPDAPVFFPKPIASEILHGHWFYPKGDSKGTVVHFHGNAQNLSAHLQFSYWLPDYGYTLVVFDYRGYGKSGGKVTRPGTIDDGKAMLEYVVKKTPPNERIHIFGQSLGGAVALASVASSETAIQSRICSLVLESTFDSYQSVVRHKLAEFGSLWLLQYPVSWMFSDQGSAGKALDKLNQNTLVLHGSADPVVPLEAGKELFENLKSPLKELQIHPGGVHTPFFVRPQSPWRPRLAKHLSELKCRKDSDSN